ncbi:MAG: HYC_CC_PP family protein [Flavobacteriaceae bacterium]
MKSIFKKIGASLLAFIVLFSTFSFTVDSHYCGEFLVDTSYFGKADDCGMEKVTNLSSKETSVKKKSCCKDVTEFIAAPNFDNQELLKISQEQTDFVLIYAYSYINRFKETQLRNEFFKDFSPPDIEQNYQALFQTFLI